MNPETNITLALTHWNRYRMIHDAIENVLDDPRIGEIVISDDVSTDGSYELLMRRYQTSCKVKLYRNDSNLDCHANKRVAVGRATNEWVILFDSDNVLPVSYVDRLYEMEFWQPQTAYCPVFAEPHFDYRAFSGVTVDRTNVALMMTKPSFATALNTANNFFRRDEYLRVWDGSVNPHTADSMWQNYNWLKAGNRLMFVPGMHYTHRVHEQSHYKLNVHKTGRFAAEVERKLRELK